MTKFMSGAAGRTRTVDQRVNSFSPLIDLLLRGPLLYRTELSSTHVCCVNGGSFGFHYGGAIISFIFWRYLKFNYEGDVAT